MDDAFKLNSSKDLVVVLEFGLKKKPNLSLSVVHPIPIRLEYPSLLKRSGAPEWSFLQVWFKMV